jgi:hypothetical protein
VFSTPLIIILGGMKNEEAKAVDGDFVARLLYERSFEKAK